MVRDCALSRGHQERNVYVNSGTALPMLVTVLDLGGMEGTCELCCCP